ncbi:hypothetical protein C1645_839750, partial [Glomus cerebriforme]
LISKWEFEVKHAAGIDNSCYTKSLVSKWEFKADHAAGIDYAQSLVSKWEFEADCTAGIDYAESLISKWEFEANRAARIDNLCYTKSLVLKYEIQNTNSKRTVLQESIIGAALKEQLVFIDKSAKDERTSCRKYGYALSDMKAEKSCIYVRGKHYTIEVALGINGIIAHKIQEGAMSSNDFYDFIIDYF